MIEVYNGCDHNASEMRLWNHSLLCSLLLPLLLPILTAQAEREPEAVSLLGRPLFQPEFSDDALAGLEENLRRARQALEETPDDPEALIWVGRRTAYLGRYREAVEVFSRGIEKHPSDARFYRHRGHRYITLRQFDRAIDDLSRAAELIRGRPDEIEPDGIPNARNQPRSTLHSNIWYHLGLAHYLKGDFEQALSSYQECMQVSTNDDMRVATSHWLYMTLRRLGRQSKAKEVLAAIKPEMDIIENQSYHHLLLLYQGVLSPKEVSGPGESALTSATVGYGIGNWHYYNGRKKRAFSIFREVLKGESWAAFGYIAAEAEVARRNLGSDE